MFGIGFPELLLILVIALVVLGPEKLPQIARMLGRGLYEIRRATEEVRAEIERGGAVEPSKEKEAASTPKPEDATPPKKE
ncbi:MAG: twin-arginine translocase subunit TatB [Nitrospirae bacterium]|nr:twin-arginine translocase subunit TatB [Candidatus Manganitrophaceae bacterium]